MNLFFLMLLRFIFCASLLGSVGRAQEPFTVRSYALPGTFNRITGIMIDPAGKAQVPLLGGIYTPADTAWFMPPRPERHITSYAPFTRDTALMILSNSEKNSLIDWVKYKSSGKISRVQLTTLPLGVYQFTKKDARLLVWGITKEGSHIGVLTKDKVRWLLNTQKLIRQVQFDLKGNICFAADSMIYNYTKNEKLLANSSSIYGFDLSADGRIYLTTQEGFGYIEKSKMVIIYPDLKGYVSCFENRIYVQPQSGDQLFEFTRIKK